MKNFCFLNFITIQFLFHQATYSLPLLFNTSQICPERFNPLYENGEDQPRSCLTSVCPIGNTCHYSKAMETYICCNGDKTTDDYKDSCPDGWTMLYQSGEPKSCLLNRCPEGFLCQYSANYQNYVCCGPLDSAPLSKASTVDEIQIDEHQYACADGSLPIGMCLDKTCGEGLRCELDNLICCM